MSKQITLRVQFGVLALGLALFTACTTAPTTWQRAPLGDTQLEYKLRGRGEPIVFVHGGVFGDWYEPLLREPPLSRGFLLINYQRAGYGGSAKLSGATSIRQQAEQLRQLLRHMGVERAHVVGHSSGGLIAIQLALDAPECVQSLVLLEPALRVGSAPPRAGIQAAFERYRSGDKAGAVDLFMREIGGPDYRRTMDAVLPQAMTQAVADADTFFGRELPAVREWSFSADDARRVRAPVLAVLGERSPALDPVWQQRQDWIKASLPDVHAFILPRATHLLYVENPRDMAERLAVFVTGHPVAGRREPP